MDDDYIIQQIAWKNKLHYTMRIFMFAIILFFIVTTILYSSTTQVYITFLWHMHQPIYTPGDVPDDAYSTILRNGGTPGGPLEGRTFSYSLNDMWASKGGPYRGWSVDAIEQGLDLAHLGAQIDLSGSLVESLNNLAYNNWNGGFYNNWKSRFQTGMNYKTSLGNPRLDVISFPYHHPMLGLIWENDMVVQFLCNIKLLKNNFSGYNSKGVFPPETSISERAIKALKQVGMEWVMVDNIHLFRTLSDYPWTSASGVVEPNKADQINGSAADKGSSWVQLNGLWAPDKVCMPWGFRPHYAQYIDPATGTPYKIMIIPADCYAGNEDARGGFGALNYPEVFGQYLPYNTDPNHPMISLLHHDGENYGAGSESYYHSNFGNYCQWLRDNPSSFVGTTIQDYLDLFPPDPNDIVHFESGGWIGSGCLDPEFHYWLGDPDPYPTGYSPDWNSWAVITAARNWVMSAYASVRGSGRDYFELTIDDTLISDILNNSGNLGSAFHYYIRSQASCYEYWEGGPDEDIWNADPTVSCNKAVSICQTMGINSGGNYGIGPSIFLPQRQPYNPGGTEWGTQQPSDFEVWTFIYDLNGVSSAVVKYRTDDDGVIDDQNYTYSGTAGTINSISLSSADLPSTQRPSTPTPYFRAKRYYATISGINNKYVDYWIEATDNNGNISKSPIMHVWVGQGGGGGGTTGRWKPENPTQNDIITVYGDKPGKLHWGVNSWTLPITNYWPEGTVEWGDNKSVETPLQGVSSYTINIGPFNNSSQSVTVVDFVFHYDDGTWDNNNGSDYHIPITISTGNSPPSTPTGLSAQIGCSLVHLSWNQNIESDLSYYNIYRKIAGGSYGKIDSVFKPTNIYNDYTVNNGTTYFYYITAVDTESNESGQSSEVSATPQQQPVAPSGIDGYEFNKTAKISWQFNSEIDIKNYSIYRSIVSGSGYTKIKTVGKTTNYYTDSTVSSYTTYYYVITASNTNHYESNYSSEVSVYIPGGAPSEPNNLRAYSETNKVYLIWDQNSEPDFLCYKLYRTNNSMGYNYNKPIVILTNATNNEYMDINVTNGGHYFYVVRAVNSNNQSSSNSNEVDITVDAKPSPPYNLTASAGDKYVQLQWNPNMETNLKGYYVYRSLVSGGPYSKISNNGTALLTNTITSYKDTNVINGTTYYYVVTALNNLYLESDYSKETNGTPYSNVTPPVNPVENFVISNVAAGNSLKLYWKSGGSDYAGALIIRNREGYTGYPEYDPIYDNGKTFNVGELVGEHGVVVYFSNGFSFTNSNLINGNTYYYKIYAFDNEYRYSTKVQNSKKCIDSEGPATPTGLLSMSGYKYIDLIWNKITEIYDFIKYIVLRKKVGSSADFQNISNLISDTNYRDSSIDYNTKYIYAVVAYDSFNNYSEQSISVTNGVFIPTGLSGKNGNNYIYLSWKSSSEDYLTGYNIYRKLSTEEVWHKVNSDIIWVTKYNDYSITPGAEYNYYIKSVDTFSNESEPSEIINVTAVKSVSSTFEIRNNLINLNSDNNTALIYYKVEKPETVKISIYDVNGKLIKNVLNTYYNNAEDTPLFIEWDGRDIQNELVGSGVYFCILKIGDKKIIKRIVVVK